MLYGISIVAATVGKSTSWDVVILKSESSHLPLSSSAGLKALVSQSVQNYVNLLKLHVALGG